MPIVFSGGFQINGGYDVRPALNPSLSWQTNQQGAAVTFTAGSTSFSSTATTSNGYGTFTGVLPLSSFYVDVTLGPAYTGGLDNVGFLGISNTNTAFDYTVAANFKAWYWSGSWFGNGTNFVNPPGGLVEDTYRIAVNYSNNRLYIKRNGSATVAQAAFTTGSNYYLMMLGQSGYTTVGVSILNGGSTFSGSGGLY
jgi:hypothetical protein